VDRWGAGTLFRPETPILLIAAAIVFWRIIFFLRGNYRRWFLGLPSPWPSAA